MNIKTKTAVVIGFIGLVCFSFAKPNSETKPNNMIIKTEKVIDGAKMYQKNYSQFKYYIETIGVVTIDDVKLNNGKLTAIYSYKHGSEVRHVVSELDKDNDGIYKGTCTTKVNGKILFAVNTWLTFNQDGSGSGTWNFSGIPSKNDPIVTISK